MCGGSIFVDTRRCLDMALDSPALGGPVWAGELGQMLFRGPFQHQPAVALWIGLFFFFPNSNQALEYQQILTRVFISTEYPYLCFCFGGWLVGLFVILGTCSYLRALKRSLATFVSVIAADEIKPLSTSACGWIIMLALKPRALQVSFQI